MQEKSNLQYVPKIITTTNRTNNRTHERIPESIKKLRRPTHYKRNCL